MRSLISNDLRIGALCRSNPVWQEHHIVFPSQFLEEPLLRLSDFLFILFETSFHIGDPVNHHAPEQLRQLAGQREIGYQATPAALESAIEASQGLVHTATDAASYHTEQASGPIPTPLLTTSALATLTAARRQTQPSRK